MCVLALDLSLPAASRVQDSTPLANMQTRSGTFQQHALNPFLYIALDDETQVIQVQSTTFRLLPSSQSLSTATNPLLSASSVASLSNQKDISQNLPPAARASLKQSAAHFSHASLSPRVGFSTRGLKRRP
jgi:hypothetical protein